MARQGRVFIPGVMALVPLDRNPQGGVGRERNIGRYVVPRTAGTTLTGVDDYVPVDATAGAVTISLPNGDGASINNNNLGAEYIVLKTDASTNAVTITPATWSVGTDTINGSTSSLVIKQRYAGYRLTLRSGGTGAVSNGAWEAELIVPGAADPLAARRVGTPLTAYGATDGAVVIPAADGAAGWGAAATFAVETSDPPSNDLRGKVSVSASGTPGANPTVAVTYKDGAFAVAPLVSLTRYGTAGLDWVLTANSTTGFTATALGTPASGSTYRFLWALAL